MGNQYADMRPLKVKKLQNRRVFAWDTETRDGLKGSDIFCWGIALSETNVVQGSTIQEFFQFLDNFELMSKERKVICYVHNLGFDVRFLVDYCLTNSRDFFMLMTGSSCLTFQLTGNPIKFVDSAQFLKSTQETAEIEYDVAIVYRKINCNDLFDIDFSEWTKKDMERVYAHNRNDVIALRECMVKLREMEYSNAQVDVLNVITPAQLSVSAFRCGLESPLCTPFVTTHYNEQTKRIYYKPNWKLDDFVRESYYGGRTEVFNTNLVENVRYVDVVSMYPFVMKTMDYPSGIPYFETDSEVISESLGSGLLCVVECYAQAPDNIQFPVLPYRVEGKTCFPKIGGTGVWCSPEIQYAKECGYTFTFKRALIYPSSEKVFEKYVTKFFEIKKTTQGGQRKLAKLHLNSLYGKFGQKFIKKSKSYAGFKTMELATEFAENSADAGLDVLISKSDMYGFLVTTEEERVSAKPINNVGFSAFITSYARIHLLKFIHYLEKRNVVVYYCDTDSVVISSGVDIELGKEIGMWDIEKEFINFRSFAPKLYCAEMKKGFLVKMKGVRRYKVREICERAESFDELMELMHQTFHFKSQYVPVISSLMRFKQALSFTECKKSLTFVMNKRVVNEDGTTKPLTESEIGLLL